MAQRKASSNVAPPVVASDGAAVDARDRILQAPDEIDQIFASMERMQNLSVAQAHGIATLRSLSSTGPEKQFQVGQRGGILIILRAMNQFPKEQVMYAYSD